MVAGHMEGAQNLQDLFKAHIYTIDYYQREYSWPASDVRRLVLDLWNEFNNSWNRRASRKRRLAEGEPYFLGPFVYYEERPGERVLVDGQQRFTTLHLLFIVLRRLALERNEIQIANALNNLIEHYPPGTGAEFRIRIYADEREPLLRARHENRLYRLPPNASLSLRNLWDRAEQLDALLREQEIDDALHDFTDWLRDRVVMAGIRAVNKHHGFKIFETMNDRGARLTSVDLVKSFLLSSSGDRQDELNRSWRAMLSELTAARQDPDVPRNFLRDALVAQHADLASHTSTDAEEISENLNAWVRDHTPDLKLRDEDDYAKFIDDLTSMARNYQMFLSAAEAPRSERALESIYYNAVNGIESQYKVLLAAVKPGDDTITVQDKARLLANYIDRRYVLRAIAGDHVDDQHLFEELSALIPALRKCVNLADVASVLRDATAEEDQPFADMEAFAFRPGNIDQVRYLLARLIAYVETETVKQYDIRQYLERTARADRWQIEHLWPTTFDPGMQGLSPRHFENLRNQIGALVLLPANDNASLQDMPYGEKIAHYRRQPNLLAILHPAHRQNYPILRRFIDSHGLAGTFRSFGDNPVIADTVRARRELYIALSERIWSPAALGFGQETTPVANHSPAPKKRSAPAQRRTAGATKAAAGGRTTLARMVRAEVIQVGQKIYTVHEGTEHQATVVPRGLVELYEGVRYNSPDAALKGITGRPTRRGMDLWLVQVDGQRISLNQLRVRAEKAGVKLL
ncbi:GmrSD restriction endonuclease domain-containing protein [Parafrankia sp. FMc2]|uniref:GmrSD restriction endonuclease domain-containing protein n=1 Tax=Parafrankia sp. FMc2 TaxID=3233196 RepID=UPI0034D3DD02